MVLAVCRRVLGNAADVEDAFQAAFLVLVRKAASLTGRAVLGDWLHAVAHRTALGARRACARRRAKEQAMARPNVQSEAIEDDWLPLLDEELRRLPEYYRLPIVLCDLEGKSRREAADRLGWPPGTVAGRLARGRALLARRLGRHGGAVPCSALTAVLAHSTASAGVPEALMHGTARAASLLVTGTVMATPVISTRVAALSEGVVRAMFLAKLKPVTCALALTVLLGLGGAALVAGGGHLPTAAAATAPQEMGDAKPEAQKLVQQLGDPSFAKRQAAEKVLANMGAPAAAAVRAGMAHADAEIARRCTAIWPRLWQTEIARPDADRLAGYPHPLWTRFRKVAGDDPGSRTLFAEMVADLNRFRRLEAVEADPQKAGAAYAAELKQRAEALNRGYQEAVMRAATTFGYGPLGPVRPTSGIPARSELVTLLFLGTYPATAREESAPGTHPGVFLYVQSSPPALRRLFAAWLRTRTDPPPIEAGLSLALLHGDFPEVAPVAVAHAANAKLAPRARGLALLVVGGHGKPADLPVLEKAFADSRVFHMSQADKQPVEVRVSDVAVAAALRLAGQEPADFGFTLMERYKMRGPGAFHTASVSILGLLGFFDDTARQAAHKKAIQWLGEHNGLPSLLKGSPLELQPRREKGRIDRKAALELARKYLGLNGDRSLRLTAAYLTDRDFPFLHPHKQAVWLAEVKDYSILPPQAEDDVGPAPVVLPRFYLALDADTGQFIEAFTTPRWPWWRDGKVVGAAHEKYFRDTGRKMQAPSARPTLTVATALRGLPGDEAQLIVRHVRYWSEKGGRLEKGRLIPTAQDRPVFIVFREGLRTRRTGPAGPGSEILGRAMTVLDARAAAGQVLESEFYGDPLPAVDREKQAAAPGGSRPKP
jgi:RNA polymerase sigma factor (sigma-70 family)